MEAALLLALALACAAIPISATRPGSPLHDGPVLDPKAAVAAAAAAGGGNKVEEANGDSAQHVAAAPGDPWHHGDAWWRAGGVGGEGNGMAGVRHVREEECGGCREASPGACAGCLGGAAEGAVVVVSSGEAPRRREGGQPWMTVRVGAALEGRRMREGEGKGEGGGLKEVMDALGKARNAGDKLQRSLNRSFPFSLSVTVTTPDALLGMACVYFARNASLLISSDALYHGTFPVRDAWLASLRGEGDFPLSCFVCIVTMGTAVPLAVNAIL